MPEISNVLFDVGGVLLVDFIDDKIADLAAKYEKPGEIGRMFAVWKKCRPIVDRGLMEEELFWKEVLNAVGIEATGEDIGFESYFKEIPGGITLARNLKENGFKISILSNDSHAISRKRRHRYGFDALFHDIVISCHHGVIKPDLTLYRIALERLKTPPENCVFLDDRPANIEAARQLGINGIYFQNTHQATLELEKLGIG